MNIRICAVVFRASLALGLGSWMLSAPASAQQPPVNLVDPCAAHYVIGPEDVLDVAVWDNAALTRTVSVRPDGQISLPLLNDVRASGLTPMQLRDRLTEALAAYIPEPSVSVLVREIHSFKVSVMGQVRTPGRYELKDRATVLDVLAMAGGFTEYASRDRTVVLRQENGATRRIPFPYDRLTTKGGAKNGGRPDGRDDVCLRPGDVILVP